MPQQMLLRMNEMAAICSDLLIALRNLVSTNDVYMFVDIDYNVLAATLPSQ